MEQIVLFMLVISPTLLSIFPAMGLLPSRPPL